MGQSQLDTAADRPGSRDGQTNTLRPRCNPNPDTPRLSGAADRGRAVAPVWLREWSNGALVRSGQKYKTCFHVYTFYVYDYRVNIGLIPTGTTRARSAVSRPIASLASGTLASRQPRYFPDPSPERQIQNPCIPMQNHTPPGARRPPVARVLPSLWRCCRPCRRAMRSRAPRLWSRRRWLWHWYIQGRQWTPLQRAE